MENKVIKILGIDDNRDNLIILKALIQESFPHALVFFAETGEKGLELAAMEDPDVILLDIVMPGMDGFEVCRRLKSNIKLREIPVVFLTAIKGDRQSRIRALECGAEAFLMKPIDESELTAQICAMVKIKTANAEKNNEKQRLAQLVEEQTRELKKTNSKTIELLESLKIENESRRKSEKAMLEAQRIAHLGSFEQDMQNNTYTWSEEGIRIFGASSGDSLKTIEQIAPFIHPDDRELLIHHNEETIIEKRKSQIVFRIIRPDGQERIIDKRMIPEFDETGRNTRNVGTVQDITESKRAEEKIGYLINYDQLTGLHNRRFYELELNKLCNVEYLPLTLIMADINGLKLTNDSFGHKAGDLLLIKAANVLKKECGSNGIVSRIGGDEFVILLPKTDEKSAGAFIEKINTAIEHEKIDRFILSISIGFSVKNEDSDDINKVFKEAEDNMYRQKLYESSSMRSKTVDLIMSTLFEKSNREMMHSKRVSEICEAIATKIELDKNAINQIKTAGLMHDIGKIGIDENILNKQSSLTQIEWIEMKKHSEIGYRILSSVKEFSETACFVLEHHERWDGKGYPKGLKGDEISLQAKIIAVADAYDAMTSTRAYRKAINEEDAINEIKRCSGTQFDPAIVKVFVKQVCGKTTSSDSTRELIKS